MCAAKIAFVLSGGASLGAVQVGQLQALAERGIRPDMVFGASAGAINGAWIAGDPNLQSLDELAEIWTSLRVRSLFPFQPVRGFVGFIGRRNSLTSAHGLRDLVRRHVRFPHLESAPIPLSVVATEVTTGREVVLDSGPVVDAVLASAAIPGLFPPVVIGGRTLIDGGVVNNTPISHAIAAGASRVYVLPTGYACNLSAPPRSALGMTLQAVSLLVQQRLIGDVAEFQGRVDLRVIPPLCPLSVAPSDFSQAATLIARSRIEAAKWLDRYAEGHAGRDQTTDLQFHHHGDH